jgi:protein-tyrosine phosphatase
MAYNTECRDLGFNCTRIQHWSNPDINYNGVPTGVPAGQPDSADNRLTLNNTAYTVANFRPNDWQTAYEILFDNPSDLELLRQYRDEILANTTRGVIYKTLLYKFSKQALEVMLSNPELMLQAKDLIDAKTYAVLDVLDGYEGIIYNTDEIVSFLDTYAQKSPPILKILAYIVKWDMLRKQRREELFFGFRLK